MRRFPLRGILRLTEANSVSISKQAHQNNRRARRDRRAENISARSTGSAVIRCRRSEHFSACASSAVDVISHPLRIMIDDDGLPLAIDIERLGPGLAEAVARVLH